ncbi:MAG: helix-turn-helix domain-containing protein [Persicimonas sp.]
MNNAPNNQRPPIDCGRSLVGSNIRRLRSERDLSQQELAAEAGINRAYLSTVENGKRNISIDNIVAIANALMVDPRQLLRPVTQ